MARGKEEMYEHLSSCFSGLRWILTLQTWSAEKAEKRAQQINFILNNEDGKRSQWFYFDMDRSSEAAVLKQSLELYYYLNIITAFNKYVLGIVNVLLFNKCSLHFTVIWFCVFLWGH